MICLTRKDAFRCNSYTRSLVISYIVGGHADSPLGLEGSPGFTLHLGLSGILESSVSVLSHWHTASDVGNFLVTSGAVERLL